MVAIIITSLVVRIIVGTVTRCSTNISRITDLHMNMCVKRIRYTFKSFISVRLNESLKFLHFFSLLSKRERFHFFCVQTDITQQDVVCCQRILICRVACINIGVMDPPNLPTILNSINCFP